MDFRVFFKTTPQKHRVRIETRWTLGLCYTWCHPWWICSCPVRCLEWHMEFDCIGFWSFEPCHEIMVLFVLRKLTLQTRMRSHPVRVMSDCWSDTSSTSILHVCEQRRFCRLWHVIRTIISWAGYFCFSLFRVWIFLPAIYLLTVQLLLVAFERLNAP